MKKKLILCLLLCIVLLTSAASAAQWTFMKVVVQDARVRKGPGDSDIITSLDKGTKVIAVARPNKSYYKVKMKDGSTGYIFRDHLKSMASADSSKVYKTTARVNLRRHARARSSLVKTLRSGTYVKLISKSGGWAHIQTADGKKGYLRADYLKKVK